MKNFKGSTRIVANDLKDVEAVLCLNNPFIISPMPQNESNGGFLTMTSIQSALVSETPYTTRI